ncbi:serine/threonine-protein kinase [Streptomyces sp. CBMA152]|uniref:serine/threonine-protein kinase n=1 Tax=Streptomyces sp. CBMA152 TaxID=1896312 RepID=UPI001660FDC9|nr:serine/threonine-protein kinase [Streptomyces sp. CBMA152]MBD0741831.1 serine/threonine protein kinase [Streptomyces sp. CBMA152]
MNRGGGAVRGTAGAPDSGDRTDVLPRGHRVGRWEVGEPIGAGGWATVHAGLDVEYDGERSADPREVALKFLPTAGLAPRQARKIAEAARREVELARRAPHPRLIRLLDSVVLSDPDRPSLDGAIVLVMERARGSLRDALGTGVTATEAARLLAGICEGLAHLHRSGWVHGDLKPDNVLLMSDRSVRLSDFGLATELTGADGTHGYAPPMGTMDYLPPERWKAPLGEHGVRIRPTADIWALGVMIHEVFTGGASPFPGATPVSRGAAAQEYADGRAPLRMDDAVPPFWRALAADCLAPDHAARAEHTAERLLARITAHLADGSAGSPRRGKRGRTALLALKAGAATAVLWAAAAGDGAAALPDRGEPVVHVRVFNADLPCRLRPTRDAECSLGLAIDPMRAYTADNVVPQRVWHGDVLDADCELADGKPIIDETDAVSTRWFRVRLDADATAPVAWLPAVRTRDHPALPACPAPAHHR